MKTNKAVMKAPKPVKAEIMEMDVNDMHLIEIKRKCDMLQLERDAVALIESDYVGKLAAMRYMQDALILHPDACIKVYREKSKDANKTPNRDIVSRLQTLKGLHLFGINQKVLQFANKESDIRRIASLFGVGLLEYIPGSKHADLKKAVKSLTLTDFRNIRESGKRQQIPVASFQQGLLPENIYSLCIPEDDPNNPAIIRRNKMVSALTGGKALPAPTTPTAPTAPTAPTTSTLDKLCADTGDVAQVSQLLEAIRLYCVDKKPADIRKLASKITALLK